MYASDAFMHEGGSEVRVSTLMTWFEPLTRLCGGLYPPCAFHPQQLAPCSTTEDLEIAVRYATNWDGRGSSKVALIFRVIVQNFMDQAPDLSFLSVFPHEKECLYPPLSYFQPVRKEKLSFDGTDFAIVDVKPRFPT